MSQTTVALSSFRFVQMGIAIFMSASAFSCDSRREDSYPIIIGEGGTCGDWDRAPLHARERSRECRSDLVCQYFVEVNDANGGTYGRCRPREELDACLDGWREAPHIGLRCFLECTTTADCPQPFQICSEGVCAIVDCANESDVPMRDPACESRLSPDDHANILCDRRLCVLEEDTK